MSRIIGIDPGSSAGVCCLQVAPGLPLGQAMSGAGIIGFRSINRSASKKLTDLEKDMKLLFDIQQQLDAWEPIHHVVIEEPKDGKSFWSSGGRGSGTATSFGLGKNFALALAAAYSAGFQRGADRFRRPDVRTLTSYTVGPFKGKAGWMPRTKTKNLTHQQKRERTIFALRSMISELDQCGTATYSAEDLSEHEIMAFGIVRFHLSQTVV